MSDFWEDQRVLVTGGAGLIGSHLCELLAAKGARVTVADNFERGSRRNVPPGCAVVVADLTDFAEAQFACAGQRVVFNLAAKVTSIDYNATHHAMMFFRNMLLQSMPLAAAQACGATRFVQASTVCVYPHDAPLPTPEGAADVQQPEPTNVGYGLAKLMGERLAQWYAQEYGLEVAITRFANAYGPRDYFDWETSHVIPALIRKCLEHETIEMWGDGEQRREFLYARDAAEGILRVAECYPKADPVNIGTGKNISMNELLALIQERLGTHKPVAHRFDKPTGHRGRLADRSKLLSVLGWEPPTSLEDGLRQTIEWYRREGLPA